VSSCTFLRTENESTLLREVSFPWKRAGSRRRNLSKLVDRKYDPVSQFIHLSLLLRISITSLIHLVLRSDSCPNTFTWSQSITWFSLVAWSVMADLFCCSSADLLLCLVYLDMSLASTSFLCSLTRTHRFLPVSPTYTLSRTIRNELVHPKEKVQFKEVSECIYQIPCKNCDKVYVGETGRNLGVRVGEHKKEVEAKDISRYTRQSKRSAEEQQNKSAITVSQTMQRKKITW